MDAGRQSQGGVSMCIQYICIVSWLWIKLMVFPLDDDSLRGFGACGFHVGGGFGGTKLDASSDACPRASPPDENLVNDNHDNCKNHNMNQEVFGVRSNH